MIIIPGIIFADLDKTTNG